MAIVDGLITLAEAKSSIGVGVADTSKDSTIEWYVEAATPVIENITGPLIERTRVFTVDGGADTVLLPVRFSTVVSVVESGVTLTDVLADGDTGLIRLGSSTSTRSFKDGYRNVVITVTVGMDTVDYHPNVRLAALELVTHWWRHGKQGNRPSFGNEAIDSPGVMFGVPTRRLEELLAPDSGLAGFA